MVKQGNILGHIVSQNGISTDLDKIKVIVDLPRPKNVKEVQAFMGHWMIYLHVCCDYKASVWTSSSVYMD